MAAAGDDMDCECIKCFQKFVVKEHASSSKLTEAEKNFGKGTTVRRIIKECLCESNDMVSTCEASIYPKYQEKQTKKMSAENFVKKVLPDLAAAKAKKSGDAETILKTWKEKMVKNLGEADKTAKNDAVVNRLTDTSKYTGSHKQRFDAEGKGKGAEGREDRVDNKGYVGAYKGEGTFGQKK